MAAGRVAEVVLRDVMTTNATELAIDIAALPLAGRRLRRGVPGDAKAAGEYAEIKQRLARLWPVMLYFFARHARGRRRLCAARFVVPAARDPDHWRAVGLRGASKDTATNPCLWHLP